MSKHWTVLSRTILSSCINSHNYEGKCFCINSLMKENVLTTFQNLNNTKEQNNFHKSTREGPFKLELTLNYHQILLSQDFTYMSKNMERRTCVQQKPKI